jgi:hypothetical protein
MVVTAATTMAATVAVTAVTAVTAVLATTLPGLLLASLLLLWPSLLPCKSSLTKSDCTALGPRGKALFIYHHVHE